MSASQGSPVSYRAAANRLPIYQQVRQLLAVTRRIWLVLASALGFALGMQAFSTAPAFADSCPNQTGIFQDISVTSMIAGSTGTDIVFNFKPDCGFDSAANNSFGRSSQVYIVVPAPASGGNWTKPQTSDANASGYVSTSIALNGGGTDTSSTVTVAGSGTTSSPWIIVVQPADQLFDPTGSNCALTSPAEGCILTITYKNPRVQELAATALTSSPTSALFALAACNAGRTSGSFQQNCGTPSSATASALNTASNVTCDSGCSSPSILWIPGGVSGTSLGSGFSNCTACAQSVLVYPAATVQYSASNVPGSATAGTAFTFNVTAEDTFGNTTNIGTNDFASLVSVSSTDSQASSQQSVQFSSGFGTTDVTLKTSSTTGWTFNVDAPTCSFSGGGGSGATCSPKMNGVVVAAGSPGSGYTSSPTCAISGGGGSGATCSSSLTNAVDGVTLSASGSGYSGPSCALSSGGGSGATCSISGVTLSGVSVASAGSGYTTSLPTCAFSGGGGSGATCGTVTGGLNAFTSTTGSAYRTVPTCSVTGNGTCGVTVNVTNVIPSNVGSGYTVAPACGISAPPAGGVQATCTASISGGTVSATITNAGSGYTARPTCTLTGGTHSGTAAACSNANTTGVLMGIDNPTVTATGSAYTAAPTCTITGTLSTAGTPTAATCSATIKVTSVSLTAAGSGYTSVPTCTLSGGTNGSGATCATTVGISSLSLGSGGSGYTSAPTCTISDSGTGSGATCTTGITSTLTVSLTASGSGYTSTPTCALTGGGGTGATCYAYLGSIGSISVTAAGSGYTSAPTCSLSGGGGTGGGSCTAAVSGGAVTGITVNNGGSYRSVTTTAVPTVAGTLNKLVVTVPTSATAGTAFSVTVKAADVFANTVTTYSGTVAFASTDGSTNASKILPSNYTFVAGTDLGSHTFTNGFTLVTSGNQSITASDNTNSVNGVGAILINPGSATGIAFSSPPSTASAGTPFSLTVQAKDTFGNLATGYTSTVTFTITDSSGLTNDVKPSAYTFASGDAGSHIFTNGFTLVHVGSPSISGSDGTFSTGTQTFSVTSSLAATTLTASVTSGLNGSNQATAALAVTVLVSAADTFGNTVTSGSNATDTIAITSSDTAATLPANAALSSGTKSFSVTLNTASGTGWTITATDVTHGTVTAVTTSQIPVLVGAASQIKFTTQPGGTLSGGTAFGVQPVIKLEDAAGNIETGNSTSTVTVSIAAATGTSGATLSGTTTLTFSSGSADYTGSGLAIDKAGGNYQLQAISSTFSQNSNAFTISIGGATKLAFTTQPGGTITGGVAFPTQPVVAIQDAGGNTVTTDTSTVTVAVTGGTPAISNSTKAAVNGVATFTAATINLAGTGYTLTATDTDGGVTLTAAVSSGFNVTVGSAAKLVFSIEPGGSPTGGLAFPTQPVVQVQDAGGNAVTSSSVSVTLTIDTSSTGTGSLGGTTTVGSDTSNSGKAVFTNLFINKASTTGNYVLKAASGTITALSSPAFTVSVGTPSQLAFTTQPGGALNGGTVFGTPPKVTVEDAGGNTVITDGSTVILNIVSGTGTSGATLTPGTPSESAGVVSFAGTKIDKSGTNYQLLATEGGSTCATSTLTCATSSAFNISVGSASQLSFTTQPSASTGGAAFSPQPAVQVLDAGGNVVLCVTSSPCTGGSITLAICPSGTCVASTGSGTLTGTKTATSSTSTGIATFSGLSIDKVGTYVLTASGAGTTNSSGFSITAGPGASLVFSTSPSNSTGGAVFGTQPKVTIVDLGGNTVTGSDATDSVRVSIDSSTGAVGAVLSGTATLTASGGVADWSTASTKLSINLASTSTYELVASTGTLTSATSSPFTISIGVPAQLVFSTQPAGNITGGTAFPTQPKVTVEDAGGNAVTCASGCSATVTLAVKTGTGSGALSGPSSCSPNCSASSSTTSGVATFSGLSVNLVGTTYQLEATATDTAHDPVTLADSQVFTVSSGSPTSLSFTTQPGCNPTCFGGSALGFQPVVSLSDAGGNTVTGTAVSVALTLSGGTTGATLSGTSTLATDTTSGSATFGGLSVDKSGTSYKLTAKSGAITVNSTTFNVSVGPAAKLAFTTSPGGTLTGGTAFGTQPQVTIQDLGGNPVTGDSSTVMLTIVSGTGTNGATLTSGTPAESLGVVSFSGTKIDKSGTNYQLLATEGGSTCATSTLTCTTSSAFNVSVGAASQLIFEASPSSSTGGTAFSTQPQVQVEDAGGNAVLCVTSSPCAGGSVTLAICPSTTCVASTGSGTLTGTKTATSSTSTGIATFSSLSIDKTGTYALTASGFGTTNSSSFSISAGPGASLVFTTSPSNSTGGALFGTQPKVTIVDLGGNTVTGSDATDSVVLSISAGTCAGATLGGTTTLIASAGVADWNAQTAANQLFINLAPVACKLQASSGALALGTSTSFSISIGLPAKLVFSTQPGGNITGGAAFGTQPVVAIQDAGGNTKSGDTSTVTLAITGTTGAQISNNTKAALNGIATFTATSIDLAGTGYTLTATDTDAGVTLTAAISNSFNVTVGSAAKLVFSIEPGGGPTGGLAFPTQPVVQVQDAGGNPVTSSSVSVTLTKDASSTGSGTLSGTTTVGSDTSNSGKAVFTNLFINQASATGNYVLKAASGTITALSSPAFTVSVGIPAQLAFTTQPGGGAAGGAAFPSQPVVTVQDAGGNTVTSDLSSVTLAIVSGTGTSSATLSGGTNPKPVSSGVASFSGLLINKSGTNYQLTATDGTLTPASSSAFTISVGLASQLAFSTQPSNSTGGIALATQPAVQVQDAGGNPVLSGVNVTLAIGTPDPSGGTATLSGTKIVASSTSTGIATFNGLSVNKAFNGFTLHATAGTTTPADSSGFNITPGPAVALSFSAAPGDSTGGTAFTSQPVVTITDAGGNTATGATNNIVLSISAATGTSGASLSGGVTTQAATLGVAQFSGLSIDKVGSAYQLAAQSGILTPATSSPFNITAGSAAKLAFTTQPGGTITGGTAFGTQPQVTVQDLGGNTVTGNTSTIALAIASNPGGGTLSGASGTSKAAVNGVATFSGLSINLAGNGYTLSATFTGLTPATSNSFNVSVGSAAQLVFTTQPGGTITGGLAFGTPPVVAVEDAGGNAVTGSAVSVSLTISTNTGGGTLSGGTTVGTSTSTGKATFTGVSIDKAGTGYILTATSGSTNTPSSPFNVSVGAASKLAFTSQPGGSISGGTPFPNQPAITVQDAGGNTVNDGSSVLLAIKTGTGTSGAGLGGTATLAATNGIATFGGLSINKFGTNYQLHATDGLLTAADSSAFNVSVGSASQLAFTTQPSNSTGGLAFSTQPAVQVQDPGGNPITLSSVSVTLAIGTPDPSSGTASLSGTKTVGSSTATGIATFNGLAVDKAFNGYTLHATAAGAAADSSPFNITTGAVATMVFTGEPSSSTGGVTFGSQPSVTVSDAGGNIVSGATNHIVLSISTGTGTAGATLNGSTSATAINGVANFSGLSIDKVGGSYQLEAQSGILTPVLSSPFDITAGVPNKLAFTTQPGGTITGGKIFPSQPVVAVEDAGGNPVSSAASVSLTITSGTGQTGAVLSGTTSVNAISGVATFGGLSINLVSNGNAYQLEASGAGLSVVDSNGFFINAGTATQLAFQTEPSGAVGGTALITQPTVLLEDAGGNQTASTGTSVTMSILPSTNTTGATLGGTVTANAVNGLVVFTSLKVDKIGTAYQLKAASGTLTPANSTGFDVSGGPAVAMTFSTSPSGAFGGAAFGHQPVVSFTDAGGNIASSSASVSLSITPATGTTGAQLGGTVTASAVNGVATFANVSIDKAANNYTLTASSTAAPSAPSQAFNVGIGPEATMVIVTQPIAAGLNSAMSPVVVELRDLGGNAVTASTMPVSVTLGNPGTATLSGTTPKTPTNGDATFNDLSVDTAGTYDLIFSAGTLSNVTSNTFQVATFTLALHPNNGPAGTQVAVSGTQWPQNSTVIITLGGTPIATSPSPCPTDNTGTFGPCLITIPALNNGRADIIVTDNGGLNHFTQVYTVTGGAGVVINKITPNVYAPKPTTKACPSGTCLNLTGVGFTGVTGPNQILFVKPDGSTAPAAALTAIDAKGGRTMTVVPPALANIGPTHIEIVTSHGNSDPNDPNALFSYGPLVKKITPNFFTPPIGRSAGTTKVTITGANFTGVDDPSQIMFGNVPAVSIISGGSFIATPAPRTIPPKPKDTSLIVVPPPLSSEPNGTDCVRVTVTTIAGTIGPAAESNAPVTGTYKAPANGGGPSSIIPDATQFCWGSDVNKVTPNIGPASGIDPKKLTPVVVTIAGGNLGGNVTGISLGSGGSGYTKAPKCVLTGGGGRGASCTAIVTGGAVSLVSLLNAGGGYTSAPTCTLTSLIGTGATCTAAAPVITTVKFGNAVACAPSGTPIACTITATKIIKVNLPSQAAGDPEVVPVTVTTSGGTGAGASGTVTVGTFTYGGVVNSVTLTSVKKITTKTPILTTTFTVAGKNLNNATEVDFTQSGVVKACLVVPTASQCAGGQTPNNNPPGGHSGQTPSDATIFTLIATKLTVVVPSADLSLPAGTYDVEVMTPAGPSTTSSKDLFITTGI